MVELLLALALVTLVAAFAISTWFGRSEVTFEKAVDLVVVDLRAAQVRAAFFEAPVEVVFASDGSGYEVVEHRPQGGPFPLGPPIPTRVFGSGAVFEGVRVERVLTPQPGRILFDARGSAVGSATIELSYRGERCTIELEEETGRIRLPHRSPDWDATRR